MKYLPGQTIEAMDRTHSMREGVKQIWHKVVVIFFDEKTIKFKTLEDKGYVSKGLIIATKFDPTRFRCCEFDK